MSFPGRGLLSTQTSPPWASMMVCENGESHAHAVGFGGKERLKNLGGVFRNNPAAVIVYRDLQISIFGFRDANRQRTPGAWNAGHGIHSI